MNKKLKIFTNGLLKENPLLVLLIGLCSSLGITTSVFNGLGMGVSMTFVLLMSEIVISLFRKVIPSAIRLPIFIIIIAAFTTIVQLILQAYVPGLYSALGVFIPLIVVNCIIMGRVEAFASRNSVGDAALDALGMGLGYTWVLVLISLIRELLGGGTLLAGTSMQITVIPEAYRIGILNSAPGGFLVFGFIIAAMNGIKNAKADGEKQKAAAERKARKEQEEAKAKAEAERIAAEKKAALEKAQAAKAALNAGAGAAAQTSADTPAEGESK